MRASLDGLDEAIEADENTMPYITDPVKAYATVGEIIAVFEERHGPYQEKIGLT